jgi:hypothetical protein
LPKPNSFDSSDAYVCSPRFRPALLLSYEHMFSSNLPNPNMRGRLTSRLRTAKDLTVAFLTLEDGEEARREADWEGRCSLARRPSAPAASSRIRRGEARQNECQRGSSITTGSSRVAIDL